MRTEDPLTVGQAAAVPPLQVRWLGMASPYHAMGFNLLGRPAASMALNPHGRLKFPPERSAPAAPCFVDRQCAAVALAQLHHQFDLPD